ASSVARCAAPTTVYPLSLHDALPISAHRLQRAEIIAQVALDARYGALRQVGRLLYQLEKGGARHEQGPAIGDGSDGHRARLAEEDRKSTRLNSSHVKISYAVFCLKQK